MIEKKRSEILKELANLKIKYWDLADITPKVYKKSREALSKYQQHLREKNKTEERIIELRKNKDIKKEVT